MFKLFTNAAHYNTKMFSYLHITTLCELTLRNAKM